MVLEWSLLQDRSSLLRRQSTSQGNMGDSEPPDILCESCACIIHRATCPLLVKHSMINLSLTSEESLTDSKLPLPEDQGTGVNVRNLCLCHSHYSTRLHVH